jgi:adenosylmethionine-8-amino-7-oxononanoate aminotransferase
MNDWLEKDLRYNWHPYTQMRTLAAEPPLLITRAEGRKLYDADGNAYYDAIASWWCNVHGHGHPRLREAATRQMAELDHVLFGAIAHRPAIALAERLVQLAPAGLTRVFYSDNGSTAVEVALKMSLQYWQNFGRPEKCRFISLDRGYHGDTVGCMSVSGVALFRETFAPLLFPVRQAPTPDCYRCPSRAACPHADFGRVARIPDADPLDAPACLAPLAALLAEAAGETAALILEPLLMGAGGMRVYPPAYLREAAALARRHHVHLILDEVATGFGRTGPMFACERAGIAPDFLCLSKGLTGGIMPLAATLTSEEIFTAFLDTDDGASRTFYHGHTFTANPIGCAVALASLDLFDEEGLLAHVADIAPRVQAGMRQFAALPGVGEVRGIGMVAALELVADPRTHAPLPPDTPIMPTITRAALDAGVLLRPMGNVSYLFLPQSTTVTELDDIFDRLARVYTGVLRDS